MTRFSLKTKRNKQTNKKTQLGFYEKESQIQKKLTFDEALTSSIFRYLIERQSFRKIHSLKYFFVFFYVCCIFF